MAGFAYTNNTKFTPFSYQEMLAPMLAYTQAHQAQEDAYNTLTTEAGNIGSAIDQYNDRESYIKYKNYENALREQAKALSRSGLTPGSRKALTDLKALYASDVSPIQKAIETRTSRYDEQRKLNATNPNIMFDVDFSKVSLDDLVKNPNMGYKTVSGDDLYAKGKEAAASASARNIETLKALSGQYWQIRQGYGADAANQFLLDQSSIPELKQAVDRIVRQSDVTDNNRSRAIDYTISGIMSGLNYNEKYQAERSYMSPAEAARLQMAKEEHEWKKEEAKGVLLPDGSRLKTIGAGRAILYKPDGSTEYIGLGNSSSKTENPLTDIKNQAKLSGEPFIVAYNNGKWRAGREGDDVKDNMLGWFTRNNLINGWGDYDLKNLNNAEPVTDINSIPREAAAMIANIVSKGNLDFNKYVILQVKAKAPRAVGDYDYILYPKEKLEEMKGKNSTDTGNTNTGSTDTGNTASTPEDYENLGLD